MELVLLHAGLLAGMTAVLIFGAGVLEIQWCRNVFRAWDYLGAAVLGGDGRHSISAYCGARNTVLHRIARWAIDKLFGQGHCEAAARKEGLLE